MSFLCRVAGLPFRDRLRGSVLQERLRVELLLLHMQRSQMRRFIWEGCLLNYTNVQLGGDPGHDGDIMCLSLGMDG